LGLGLLGCAGDAFVEDPGGTGGTGGTSTGGTSTGGTSTGGTGGTSTGGTSTGGTSTGGTGGTSTGGTGGTSTGGTGGGVTGGAAGFAGGGAAGFAGGGAAGFAGGGAAGFAGEGGSTGGTGGTSTGGTGGTSTGGTGGGTGGTGGTSTGGTGGGNTGGTGGTGVGGTGGTGVGGTGGTSMGGTGGTGVGGTGGTGVGGTGGTGVGGTGGVAGMGGTGGMNPWPDCGLPPVGSPPMLYTTLNSLDAILTPQIGSGTGAAVHPSPTFPGGYCAQSISIGPNQYVRYQVANNMLIEKGSLDFWILLKGTVTAGAYRNLFWTENSGSHGDIRVRLNGERLEVILIGNDGDEHQTTVAPPGITPSAWTRVTIAWDFQPTSFNAPNVRVYLNRVLAPLEEVSQASIPLGSTNLYARFIIGASSTSDNNAANALFDDFKIYGFGITPP
jgi:hypothetical protein